MKPLDRKELVAIALGGMIGGGIFSILGISVQIVGQWTPLSIFFGGVLALCAAYSYAKLASFYKDEGATYSFFKKTFPNTPIWASIVGWLIVFGYISTLSLYSFTFSSYLSTLFPNEFYFWLQPLLGIVIINIFGFLNIFSVRGMGKVEDILVYTKVIILIVISLLFIWKTKFELPIFQDNINFPAADIITCAAITFVAYEGFQLVIHAYNEVEDPKKNVPQAIYLSVAITTLIYVLLSLATTFSVSIDTLIQHKEFALAAAAKESLGYIGYSFVVIGALLATSSAINGTIFGASRLMAVISEDLVFPRGLADRVRGNIPQKAIIVICLSSCVLLLSGGLKLILEFGSITFILVSFLMALSNFKLRKKTNSNTFLTVASLVLLAFAVIEIIHYEWVHDPLQIISIVGLYSILSACAIYRGVVSVKKS